MAAKKAADEAANKKRDAEFKMAKAASAAARLKKQKMKAALAEKNRLAQQ